MRGSATCTVIREAEEGYKILALTLLKQSISDILSGDRSKTQYGHMFLKSKLGKSILAHYGLENEIYQIIKRKRNDKQYRATISK